MQRFFVHAEMVADFVKQRVADLGEKCFAVGRDVLDVSPKQSDAIKKTPIVGLREAAALEVYRGALSE